MVILVLVLKNIESEDKTKYDTFYSDSKAEIIINESDIDDVFESTYTTVISNIQKYLGKRSGWITDSVIDHNISILRYNPLYRIIKRIRPSEKRLINIQYVDDNECFKWFLIRYVNPADHHPARITKADEDFAKKLHFKDIKFPVKIRDIHKIKKKEFHRQ